MQTFMSPFFCSGFDLWVVLILFLYKLNSFSVIWI
jgi:hypothetical protein